MGINRKEDGQMEVSVDFIRLDLNKEKDKAAIYLRIGDTLARTVRCTLVRAGRVVPLRNAILASILIKKADGYESDNGVVVEGDELKYTWRTTDVSAEGENICQFVVTLADGTLISSPEFSMYAYRKVVDQKVEQSMNEYTAITQQVALAGEYADNAKRYSETAQSFAESAGTARSGAEECMAAAQAAAEAAEASEERSKASENAAGEYASSAGESMEKAAAFSQQARESSDSAWEARTQASESAQDAASSARNAAASAGTAENFSGAAKEYADTAEEHADRADRSKEEAAESAETAKECAASAQEDADRAKEYLDNFGENGNLVLGETHNRAFWGDWGMEAYEHSKTKGNPHGTTWQDVGADQFGAADAALESAKAYMDAALDPNLVDEAFYTVFSGLSRPDPGVDEEDSEDADAMTAEEVLSAISTEWDGSSSGDSAAMTSDDIAAVLDTEWDGTGTDDPNALTPAEIEQLLTI
jgi:hypothetical protein